MSSFTEISRNTFLNGLFLPIIMISTTNPRELVSMMFIAILLGPFVGYNLGKISQ
jgi:hypothetical protein